MGPRTSVGSGSVGSPVLQSNGYQPRVSTKKELQDTCVAEVLTETLAEDVQSCRIWPMEGSQRSSLRETNIAELLPVVEVYFPSANASGGEEKDKEVSGQSVDGNEGTKFHDFVAGDILQFVDGVKTTCSTIEIQQSYAKRTVLKYCRRELVASMMVGSKCGPLERPQA